MSESEQPHKFRPLYFLLVGFLWLYLISRDAWWAAVTSILPAVAIWFLERYKADRGSMERETPNSARLRSAIKTSSLDQVDMLVGSVNHGDPSVRRLAVVRLVTLTKTADAAQIAALQVHQREALYGCITLGNALEHPELVYEFLTVVERVRDPHALPFVESLATATSYLPNTDGAINRAKAVLAVLEAEAAKTVSKSVLLRSAEPDDTLLRPAGNDANVPAENLLRSAVSED